MKQSKFSVAMANLVMETVSDLQRRGEKSTLKDIRHNILEKHGNGAEKYLKLVPQYVVKGMNLGLLARYGDNYRTKIYTLRGKRRRRHRRRRRRH